MINRLNRSEVQGTDFVLVLDKILIPEDEHEDEDEDEDEDEKYQIRSAKSALI